MKASSKRPQHDARVAPRVAKFRCRWRGRLHPDRRHGLVLQLAEPVGGLLRDRLRSADRRVERPSRAGLPERARARQRRVRPNRNTDALAVARHSRLRRRLVRQGREHASACGSSCDFLQAHLVLDAQSALRIQILRAPSRVVALLELPDTRRRCSGPRTVQRVSSVEEYSILMPPSAKHLSSRMRVYQ